ncbi:hypothetical protein E2C01_048047 [Portunus trituberculatus]|uniref:Chitin-binding type-2 domain-containing protein n=1 Tax=Portunus trituberculatus TaxID=210409 RepID=A0A5B7G243_PORTR|nr:hypothetical protein [Portunus trituberculatus]
MHASTLALALVSCLALLHGATAECSSPKCAVIEGHEVHCSNPAAWHEYHPHPTDNHQYVQCTLYGPQVMKCPLRTVWNQALTICVHEHIFIPQVFASPFRHS